MMEALLAATRHMPRLLAAGALCAAVVLACGCGPVGSGGTGSPAGLEQVNFSQGPVDGFASVLVNGVDYDDSNAQVVDDDGNVLSAGTDLHLGTTVDVQVAVQGNGTSGAAVIRVHDDLVGPITAPFDASGARLEVLGESVVVDDTTFVDAIAGGLGGLATGTVVEISALYDPVDGVYHATRIGLLPDAAAYVVRGAIADDDGSKIRVGTQVFTYGGVSLPAGFAVGQIVRVRFATTPDAQGVWRASTIQDGTVLPPEGGTGTLRGAVGKVLDSSHAYVAGVLVDASTAGRAPSDVGLAPGALVVVQGTMNGEVLIASRIDFQVPPQTGNSQGLNSQYATGFEITGPVLTPVDTAARTFGLRGPTTVDYANATFTGGTAGDLAQGRKVTVHGKLSPDGSRLAAATIAIGG